MTFRMSLLSLLCVGAVSTQLKAEAMIKEVIGDQAPYFLGLIADDAVYAGQAVLPAMNQGARAWFAQGRDDCYNFGAWVLRQIKNGGIPLLRTSYHGAKIAAGVLLCTKALPNGLLGIEEQYRGAMADDTPAWKKVVKHVPTRVAGLGLIYHGLSGVGRQLGFESFSEFYNFLEGRSRDDHDLQAIVQKPKTSSQKQR